MTTKDPLPSRFREVPRGGELDQLSDAFDVSHLIAFRFRPNVSASAAAAHVRPAPPAASGCYAAAAMELGPALRYIHGLADGWAVDGAPQKRRHQGGHMSAPPAETSNS